MSSYDFLELDTDSKTITILSDEQSVRGSYTEAVLSVTVATYSWQIPLIATFLGCEVKDEFCLCDDLPELDDIWTLGEVEHEIYAPTSEIELLILTEIEKDASICTQLEHATLTFKDGSFQRFDSKIDDLSIGESLLA